MARGKSIEKEIKQRMKGLVWIVFGVLLLSIPGYLLGLAPKLYIYATNTTFGVGATAPTGGTSISLNLLLYLVIFAIALFVFFKAAREMGVSL